MFSSEIIALLRNVLDEICGDMAEHETSKKTFVASKISRALQMASETPMHCASLGAGHFGRRPRCAINRPDDMP